MTEVKAEPQKQVLKVKALRLGFYDGQRRREGHEFVLESVKEFSQLWMEPEFDVEEAKAYEALVGAPEPKKPGRAAKKVEPVVAAKEPEKKSSGDKSVI